MINRIDKIVCNAPFSRKIVLLEPAYHDGRSLRVDVTEEGARPFRESCRAGARFSKVPIINGPGKLLPFTLKIEVSIVLHLT